MSRRHKESPGQGFLFGSFDDAPAAPVPAPVAEPSAVPEKSTPRKESKAPPTETPLAAPPKPIPAPPKPNLQAAAKLAAPASTQVVMPTDGRRDLTPEQADAARLSCNRVLSASAGTGKTFTLTEIYLGLLAGSAMPGKPAPLYPSQIVAVTFTEKAAAELRDRVRRELDERLVAETDVAQLAHLRRCRDELPGAPISTIHAFCARLLREAGERPGVPAGFAVMEEAESAELLDRALSEVAAEALAEGSSSPLRTLAREWGVAPGGEFGLVPAARRLIRTLRTSGKSPEVLAPDLVEQNHRARLEATLAEIYDAIRQAPDKGRSKPPQELRELAEGDPTVGGLESARKRVLTIYYHCAGSSGSKLYKWADEAGLDTLLEEALSAAHAPYRAALAKYVEAGMAAFRREKLRAGALDFDDLLLEARRLLREDGEIAHAYSFVLIDEFQDTNPLQKDVLYRVAFPPNGEPDASEVKFAIVGDVKQSIYRFRGADVSVMAHACETLAVKPLRRNFRSRRAVIDWINGFCARTLWPPLPNEFSFDEKHALEPDPDMRRHAWQGPAGELLARPGDAEQESTAGARWKQALAIARRIRTLVAPAESSELPRPGIWLRREKKVRPEVKYSDVAILVRSLKHLRIPLELALGRMGIPFRMLGGVSFYTRPEILDVVNLLAWTADPEDTSALLGLLRSPFVQVSDAAVFDLMQADRAGPGPLERLRAFAKSQPAGWNERDREHLQRGATLLELLEARRGTGTAAGLIDMACVETGFLSVLAMQPQGETAVAAVRRLIEQSREYESRGARTLGDFVEMLRGKADAEWDDQGTEGGPDLTPDLPESLDAVQIGTVHSAKGLEFPVVVLADIGFERPGSSESALLHDRGVGLRLGCESDGMRARADSIHELADTRNRVEEEAESRRLLYVAVTRACDYLILAGEKRTKKGLWRGWIDAHEEASPCLVRVPYNHPELLAAREDAGRALVCFDDGRVEVKAPAGPAPEPRVAARMRELLEHATRPPAFTRTGRKADVSISEFARFLSCARRYRYSTLQEEVFASEELGRERGKLDETYAHAARENARALGTAAHASLEAAFSSGRSEAARTAWSAALVAEGMHENAAPARETWMRVQAVLSGAWATRVLALDPARRFPERPLRWRVDLGQGGAVVLTGTLDLLAGGARDVSWQVVDYKLAAMGDVREAAHAESLRRYAWQVGLYALAASRLLGVSPEDVEPALLFLKNPRPEPLAIGALGLNPPAPVRMSEPALKAALAAFLASADREEPPAELWLPGSVRAQTRDEPHCRAEGCPFVARCFAR